MTRYLGTAFHLPCNVILDELIGIIRLRSFLKLRQVLLTVSSAALRSVRPAQLEVTSGTVRQTLVVGDSYFLCDEDMRERIHYDRPEDGNGCADDGEVNFQGRYYHGKRIPPCEI